MKNSQKKWQPNSTESVIGMLMGFDEQLVPDKRRTLSERYLNNDSSIGRSCNRNNGVKDASRARSSNVLDKCVNSSSSNAISVVRSLEPSTSSASVKKNEHCAGRRVLRRQQKLEHDSLVGEIGFDFVNNSIKFPLDMKDSSVACTRSVRQISPPERRRSKFEHLLKAEHKDYGHNPQPLVVQSSLVNKSRKRSIERRKKAERVKEFGVSGMARNLDVRLCTNDFSSPSSLQSRSSDSSNSEVQISLQKDILESDSNVEEVVSREASLNELSEVDSAYSKCSGIGPLENLKRTSQHSPDSVLESNDTNNPRSFEHFDSLGLMLQLQALNFELEESLSDGSAIKESGDEDFELFGDLSHDGRKMKRWLGNEESRNFSYLVDVLDEAGFYDSNSFMDFNKWASLECPISPLVFDALEKKYGKQTSWQKYERLLLFDRVNSGLLDIYYPFINFHAIRRKLCASFRRDEIEEELWTMLIRQENEKSEDLSEKALEKWWEFKEGFSIICGELEASLLDELVMELASSYN